MRRQHGFSLVELMVVVAIIAILAAIAYPAYSRYGYRARRADAQNLLMKVATAEERYYAVHNKYGGLADIGFSDPAPSENNYYLVDVEATGDGGQGFVATAKGQGVQQNDVCGDLSIDNTGAKLPKADDAEANANGPCW
jgi:type IV pilus assembly protein PilE